MTGRRYGVDWSQGLFPRYESESDAYEVLIRAFAPDRPDEAAVFMATNAVMGLTRTASGREGLAVLRDFLTPGFGGHGTAEMVRRAMDWTMRAAAARRAALDNLEWLLVELEREAVAAGVDPATLEDVRAEIADVRQEIADMRADRVSPTLSTFDWLRLPAARAVARAVRGICRAYPVRATEPVDTLEKIAAARAAIARKVTP